MRNLNDETLNEQQRNSVIDKVIEWWFTKGLARLTLGTEQQNDDEIKSEQKNELNEIDLTLKSLNGLTIKCRNYQTKLFESAATQNIICFMPTGSGKTRIAIKLIEHRLKHIYLHQIECIHNKQPYVKRHIIFLVCTTHLAQQQLLAIKRCVPFVKIRKITGDQNPNGWFVNNWKLELDHFDVLVMMHDCLRSALQHGHISFNTIDTLILDECHHAIGGKRHPYTVIMEKYHQYKKDNAQMDSKQLPKIMGLTASPIKTKENTSINISTKIQQLQAMMDATLMRVENDELQAVVSNPIIIRYPYLPTPLNVEPFIVPSEFKAHLEKYVKMMNRLGTILYEIGVFGACLLLRMLFERISKKDYNYWFNFYKDQHAERERLERKTKALDKLKVFLQQNLHHFDKYLHSKYDSTEWNEQRKRDVTMKINLLMKFIADSHSGIEAIPLAKDANEEKETQEIDAYDELNVLFRSESNERQQGIIFVEERQIAYVLAEILSLRFSSLSFGVLTGHSCAVWGMNDKEQQRVIDKFKVGEINYLIATSVAEEGIDIQSCNCVIMLVLPKTIKTYIQTRGRMRQKKAKYVVFYDPNNCEQTKQLMFLEENERDMLQHAKKDNMKSAQIDYNRYEYRVRSTLAFASTVNAISMLYRYFVFLGVTNKEIMKSFDEGQHGFLCTMKITSHKWEMKSQTVFSNSALAKKEAERKVCVDIIAALKEKGFWNDNLVPIEVLKRCKWTKTLNKQRALCQSEPCFIHIPSHMNSKFHIEKEADTNIIDEETGAKYQLAGDENKIGYLYRIVFKQDVNQIPIGIILPKQIASEYLDFISFPIQMRHRDDNETKQYLFEYAKLVRETMNNEINEAKEDKNDDDDGAKRHNTKQKRRRHYVSTTVRLYSANGKNNAVSLKKERFDQLVRYHQRIFALLDHGGSKKKKHLKPIFAHHEEEEKKEEIWNDKSYVICPLKLLSDGYAADDHCIHWQCVEKVLRYETNWIQNQPNSWKYSNEKENDDSEFQLIQTKHRDGSNPQMYISYGVDEAFSMQSMRPNAGQIVADRVDEDERVNQILHCHIALDKPQDSNDVFDGDDDDQVFEESVEAVTIQAKCQKLSKHSNGNQNHRNSILITRSFAPKIRNVLVLNDKKAKYTKTNLKACTDFLPLNRVFFTGISASHFYQLLNIPAIVWRLENYFNIFDAHRLLQSISSSCNIEYDLLFEALCNAQADANKTYERLECLGDAILKCMASIYGFSTMSLADQGVLTMWKSNIVSNFNLMQKSKAIELPSYGIFKSFTFNCWLPSYFKPRETRDAEREMQISVKLPADVIESVIGALWSTINENGDNLEEKSLSVAISSSMELICGLNIFPQTLFVEQNFNDLVQEWDRGTFLHIVAQHEFQMRMKILIENYYKFSCHHAIVAACLMEFVDPFYHYHSSDMLKIYGITYQRLEFLGDALLDLIVTQFLYKDIVKNANEKKEDRQMMMSVEGEITLKRSNIVSNDSLGYSVIKNELDHLVIWTKPQIQQINQYKKDIEKLKENSTGDDRKGKEPQENWYLQAPAPKCLGDAFECLLAIVFMDENYQMFQNDTKIKEIKLRDSIEFVCTFHEYAERHWKSV